MQVSPQSLIHLCGACNTLATAQPVSSALPDAPGPILGTSDMPCTRDLCQEVTQGQAEPREVLGQAEGLGVPGCATALPEQVTPTLGHPTARDATPVCLCRCVMHKQQRAAPWERLPGQCWDNSVLSLSLQALGVHRGPPVKLSFYCPCSCPPPLTPDSL